MTTLQTGRIRTHKRYKYPANWAKPFIVWLFRNSIHSGTLKLQFRDEIVPVGAGPEICIIAPPTFLRFCWMLLAPSHRLPRQYTEGYWCCESRKLYALLSALTGQQNSLLHWWFRIFNRNIIRDRVVYKLFPLKVKENISIHYNTSPAFMKIILGRKLHYTCAFFENEDCSLETAQMNKVTTVIDRLGIERTHEVLDLGCGWGQFAEAVSAATGSSVTGINITPNQISYARANRSWNADFILTDYEAFAAPKTFDRIYSIGMVEHVGRGKLGNYFSKIAELLDVDGMALIHCIVRTKEGTTNSWIDREVFPGAYIPELSEVVNAIDRCDLQIVTIFTHNRTHYYRTLMAWLENLYDNWGVLVSILEELVPVEDAKTIMRIWEFYLSGSRLAFNDANGYCYNVQILLTRRKNDLLVD